MSGSTILSDFLKCLEVPHTGAYTDAAFRSMPFQSLFGFSRALDRYGVDTRAIKVDNKNQLGEIPCPFVAQLGSDFVIVTRIDIDDVEYILYHRHTGKPREDFEKAWTGVALLAYPDKASREPDYDKHHFLSIAAQAKTWILILSAIFVLGAGAIHAGIFNQLPTALLLPVNLAGIAVTWLLVEKSLHVATHSADKICGILQKHGCDTVLEQKASKVFGLFGWSEVGISYFTVSTAALLLFPGSIGYLTLINALCLPFTVWSIWYQRFRIHAWCTLCVTTQCLLWLQFFCYLGAGHWSEAFPLGTGFWVLAAVYAGTLMGVNRITSFISRQSADPENHQP